MACGTVFLEPDCKDNTVGMCSWSNIKQMGSPPRPKSGANGAMYVREVLPHASSHLLPGLCERNGMLRSTAKPGPLLSVGPGSPALAVFGTTQVIYTLTSAAASASPLWEPHTHEGATSQESLSSVKQQGHEKMEADLRAMLLQTKKYPGPPEAGRSKEGFSTRTYWAWLRSMALLTSHFKTHRL